MGRTGVVTRETKETKVAVEIDLDRPGLVEVSTGIPFFDHMLEQLGRHARIALKIDAQGDLEVDAHHTVEDTGISLGEALSQALGEKAGIVRYGHAVIPLDEALCEVALDLSGRPYLECDLDVGVEAIGTFDPFLAVEFFRALSTSAGISMHVIQRAGSNPHHILEASFKALARALGEAVSLDERGDGRIPSTKETL